MTDTSPHPYGEVSIERFLHSSYDQFAIASTIPHHLPLLAERFAGQRLQALARVEGHQSHSTPPRPPPWPNAASTSARSSPSRGPTRSCAPPTS
ncbi:three-helix bundle dimerization domain-containing protein [Micromonospora sp. NPDC000089]|uniref:three-helix bundle dimerization domain-containing protein n=1 Tax=unclassified Micromonospora TaxID=2617518 RepID=UPI0036CCD525